MMMMMTMMMLIMMHCDMPASEGPPGPLLPLSCPVRLLAISEKPENFALTSTSTVFFLVQSFLNSLSHIFALCPHFHLV